MHELELPKLTSACLQNILWVLVVNSLTHTFSCLSLIFLSIDGSSNAFRATNTSSSIILFISFNFSFVHSSALEL